MITTIITAFKEPRTIKKAILHIAEQKLPKNEIIVIAPDDTTLNEAKKLKTKYKNLRFIKDEAKGKSAALNLAVPKARGDILILTDGDVHADKNSINLLLDKFKDKKIGAVSGNPISTDPINTKYGLWSYVLTNVANERRKRAFKQGKRFFCSGYLFAIKKSLFPHLPEDLLSEDGFISHHVYQQGFKIAYNEKARVYVKFPSNFRDWINQKRRGIGGYNQIKSMLGIEMRSFKQESLGFVEFFKYASNIKELIWIINLFLARIYVWILIYRDINFRKKTREELWHRVESTK